MRFKLHNGEWVKHSNDFMAAALKLFWQLRQSGLRKQPSTAELLNWLMVLREMFPKEDNPLATQPNLVLRTLSSLVKTQADQQAAQRILGEWHENVPAYHKYKKDPGRYWWI